MLFSSSGRRVFSGGVFFVFFGDVCELLSLPDASNALPQGVRAFLTGDRFFFFFFSCIARGGFLPPCLLRFSLVALGAVRNVV